ncbi:MAG: hypothetical protein LBU23_03165 [Planctomycetota bacterium]|jgi:hypothetical protein|nr:hypothetical protein [Planctomycetota bacterium]
MTQASVRKIDGKLERLVPGTLRHQVMIALRQFRASWVELGRLLNEVVYGGDYKEWGYDDFEVYCARELGLKKPTIQKLMISYNYMRKYESGRLGGLSDAGADAGDGAETAGIPDFQTVELLDRARHRESADGGKLEELHRRAFSGRDDEPELRRELRQYLRPAPRAGEAGAADVGRAGLIGVLRAARELRRRLSEAGDAVPDGLRERLERSLVELEGLE